MDDDPAHRYPYGSSPGVPYYYVTDRNGPLAMSHTSRTDPRYCPIGTHAGGQRGRGTGREDRVMENAQSRRRIAIACARCRKRKIRCSGDPGDGSGCENCKNSGIDLRVCLFHRVGSDDAHQIMANRNNATNMSYMANQNAMVPFYNVAHQYPQTWTIPYSEESSPVDTYSLDPPSTCLPNPLPTYTNMYGVSIPSSYPSSDLPYVQTNLRATVGTEEHSPLNMASLHTTLPNCLSQRPRLRQLELPETSVPQRQLPIPQPSPAQSSRNIVDQLQDRRLRSAQVMGESGELIAQTTSSAPVPGVTEGVMGYMPATSSVNEPVTTDTRPSSQQQQLNFTTSTLLETMPVSAPPSNYSNFRNYNLPISASTEKLPVLARQNSHTSLYSFAPDSSSKRRSLGDQSNEAALVSGQRYTPLSQTQTRHAAGLGGLRRDSFETGNDPLHRASASDLNRGY
ncbi:hypothetical protein K505DRAFT_232118 [Melanomma pulvis-pyrius CBS 109.77]|uniref:Zn(2)-C6 fungal-type domain-containing protein n=1 Tax=Melanomma pulvis-pyrius CBS 109.77 TaxID=1314802 RepID=A0A6A6XRH3_9PLEO|nr:hypothetical protein K505DRAFT_232118 [Melanomma pulvis-pyrius CBS 109.77]